MEHLDDETLEEYYLGMIEEGPELVALEEHVMGCSACAERAEECSRYADAMRAALLVTFGLDLPVNDHPN